MARRRATFGLVFALSLAGAAATNAGAQDYPTTEQFDNFVHTCATSINLELSADLSGSIRDLYEADRTSGFVKLKRESDFLAAFEGPDKIEAYRLYLQCISSFIRSITAAAPEKLVPQQYDALARLDEFFNANSVEHPLDFTGLTGTINANNRQIISWLADQHGIEHNLQPAIDEAVVSLYLLKDIEIRMRPDDDEPAELFVTDFPGCGEKSKEQLFLQHMLITRDVDAFEKRLAEFNGNAFLPDAVKPALGTVRDELDRLKYDLACALDDLYSTSVLATYDGNTELISKDVDLISDDSNGPTWMYNEVINRLDSELLLNAMYQVKLDIGGLLR